MPTRDNLNEIDGEYVRELLRYLIANIYRFGGFYVIQQVYELGAILICKDLGEKRVQDRLCFQMITEWAVARRITCVMSVQNVVFQMSPH